MCGICGQYNFNEIPVSELIIQRMMARMKHRGPDDEGTFFEGNVGFGFVRLSIIDLSFGGHQPMQDITGRYTIVFNGEIYNYIELRNDLVKMGFNFKTKSDTEVLLTSYIAWGKRCLELLNGMFAFVIYDKLTNSIFGARDRFGVKPFYYFTNDKIFRFASEIACLVEVSEIKMTADYQSIFEYLAFNRTDQTEKTFFYGIKKLSHGFYFSIENSNLVFKEWYNLRTASLNPFTSPEEYRELLTSAIKLRLRSDVPVGVCLSGGLDSSTITSLLIKDLNISNLNSFSTIYKNSKTCDESGFIDEYSCYLKNMFFAVPSANSLFADLDIFIQAHSEPVPSTSPYAQFKLMEMAKGKVAVTLDGQGADEQLAGYHYFFGLFFKDLLLQGKIFQLIKEMMCYIKVHHSLFGFETLAFFLLPSWLRTKTMACERNYINMDFKEDYRNKDNISEKLYASKSLKDALFDHFEYKLEHLLKWSDKNSMWFSIESRAPYLDYRLVERTLASPNSTKIFNGITKYILRQSMIGVLPERIRKRKDKIGFCTPEDEWFKSNEFKILVTDLLKSEILVNRKIIDSKKALDLYYKHIAGQINISKEIWKWINLELWFRKYID